MKLKISKILLLIILFCLFLFMNTYTFAHEIFYDLSSNIFRLHILANSDSSEDQELKLKVRDGIINYLEPKTQNCKNKKEVIEIISNNIQELQKIAINIIKENGYNYNITLEIGNFYFPTKYYGNISMPARKL